MSFDPTPFLHSFFKETDEHLAHIETTLTELEHPPHDRQLFGSLLLDTNAIRGTSTMFDFPELTRFAHVVEGLLDQLKGGKVPPNQELIGLLSRAADILKAEVAAAQQGELSVVAAEEVRGELERAIVHCVLTQPTKKETQTELFAISSADETDTSSVLFS